MHFFIDPDKLTTQLPEDVYGPKYIDANTKSDSIYNVTSKFQLAQEAKAFACQSGIMIVQNSTLDESLVNVIIKPDKLLDNIPLNVQYYVYRGLLKSLFITEESNGGNCNIVDENPSTNTSLISRLYEQDTFDDKTCRQIGYDRTLADNKPVTDFLNFNNTEVFPIYVKEGEWLGTFSKDYKIGFDIILKNDNNDLDLGYLRSPDYAVDVSNFSGAEKTIKRESILNFIDPCSFFGTHLFSKVDYYDSGTNSIKTTTTNAEGTGNDRFLYTKLLNQFQTKNKIYIDIRSEKGYSYNLYGNYKTSPEDSSNIQIRTESGDGTFNIQEYQTYSWPILVLESSHATGDVNTFRFKLRIDDNRAPILYIKNYEVLKGKYIKITDSENSSNRRFNYVKVRTLIANSPDDDHTEWTNEIKLRFPNTQSGESLNYISHYLRIHYFRSEYEETLEPDSILKNQHYWDSAFCSIDIPELNLNTDLGFIESANPIYVREPNQENGTGNFQLNMKNGAYWDNSRILLYATIQNENSDEFSEKQFLNTFSQKLNFNPVRFKSSDLNSRLEIICRPYKINTTQTIKIPGINLYKHSDFGQNAKNYKENAMLFGLSKEEFQAIQNDSQLIKDHNRFIYLERQLNDNSQYFETEPDSSNENATYRYYKYIVKIQGFNNNYDIDIIEPTYNGNPILVYSRDNQFFSSILFSNQETLTQQGTVTNPWNNINRVEFHIYENGTIRINDNIDFALIHVLPDPIEDLNRHRIYYQYHQQNNNIMEICDLGVVMSGQMEIGEPYDSVKHGAVSSFNLNQIDHEQAADDLGVNNVNAHNSYENINGDVLTNGNYTYKNNQTRCYYKSTGKRTFLVKFVTDLINNSPLDVDFTYHDTIRFYARPELAAAVIGVLIRLRDLGIESTGFSYLNSTSYPSVTHVNGNAIDTRYKGNTENASADTTEDQSIIDAMGHFNFTDIIIGDNSYFDNITGETRANSRHNDHLHSGKLILNDD